MKLLFAVVTTILLCSACAQGGASESGAGTGSISMYGVVDEGVTFHK